MIWAARLSSSEPFAGSFFASTGSSLVGSLVGSLFAWAPVSGGCTISSRGGGSGGAGLGDPASAFRTAAATAVSMSAVASGSTPSSISSISSSRAMSRVSSKV